MAAERQKYSFGYKWMVHLWSGIFSLADDKKVTWKGKDENQSLATLIEGLYNYEYSLLNLTHGKLRHDLFSFNLVICKEMIYDAIQQITYIGN